MSILRDIEDVHKKIIVYIPDEKLELKNSLNEYIDSIWNLAPEIRSSAGTFVPYINILTQYLDKDDINTDWNIKITNIINATEK